MTTGQLPLFCYSLQPWVTYEALIINEMCGMIHVCGIWEMQVCGYSKWHVGEQIEMTMHAVYVRSAMILQDIIFLFTGGFDSGKTANCPISFPFLLRAPCWPRSFLRLGQTTMGGGGGDTRVSIPNNARKVIQELKKTIGPKHSDEFMYTTLKDCDMDPKEAARRLKMVHDIKEIAGKHSEEDIYTMLKECNMDPNESAQRLLYIDTFHEVKKKHDRRKSINSDATVDHKRAHGGHQWRRNFTSGKEHGVTNRHERVPISKPIIPVHSVKENNVVNGNGTLSTSNGSYSNKLAPDVSSSTPNPVVVSSKNTCAIGTIQCEIVKRSKPVIKLSADQVTEDSENARKIKSDVVENIKITSEPLKSLKEVVETIPEEKPKIPVQKTVIFPDNIKVPEIYKNHFTFGSLDLSVKQNGEVAPVPEQPSLKDNNMSSSGSHEETTKVEMTMMMPPVVQRDYGFGFMPHVMGPGPQFVHLDNGGSVIPPGQGQSQSQSQSQSQTPMSMSPPVFPYFRQPFANYIPYMNPYFPLYLPQNAHLLNQGLFPHQPPPPGVKLSNSPPTVKQEDVALSKEKNNNQQGEEEQVREVPSFMPNYFYNFPHGHPMPFSPYHSSQPLMYQTGGTVVEKPMVPPQHSDNS
ncbi:hypothetical protein LXL04_037277 [Taraxacum kok-saghyz]